ncbi:Zn-ribbon containing protein [Natrialbaceae archaeon GCM10025896]
MPHQCTNCGRTFPDGSKEMLSGCPDCGGNKFQFAPSSTASSSTSSGSADSVSSGQATSESTGSSAATPPNSRSDDRDRSSTAPSDSATRTGRPSDATESTRAGDSSDDARERSWPEHGRRPPERERSSSSTEFSEWPDTARRPDDRSAAARTKAGSDSRSSESTTTDRTGANAENDSSGARAEIATSSEDPVDDRTGGERATSRSAGSDRPAAPTNAVTADSENSAQANARADVVSDDELPPAHESPALSDAPPEHGRVVSEPTGEQPSLEDLREELNQQFESIKILSPGQYELNLMELYDRDEYIISLQEDGRYVIDVPDSWRNGE